MLSIKIANCAFILILQSLIEQKIATVEKQKDDAKHLNKRFTMAMNVQMAHMIHIATQQASLPIE